MIPYILRKNEASSVIFLFNILQYSVAGDEFENVKSMIAWKIICEKFFYLSLNLSASNRWVQMLVNHCTYLSMKN